MSHKSFKKYKGIGRVFIINFIGLVILAAAGILTATCTVSKDGSSEAMQTKSVVSEGTEDNSSERAASNSSESGTISDSSDDKSGASGNNSDDKIGATGNNSDDKSGAVENETTGSSISAKPTDDRPYIDPDDEYLILINKTHSLASDYEPDDLVVIKNHAGGQNNKLRENARDAIDELFEAAAAEGYTIKSISAYRTYAYQEMLFTNYTKKHGLEKAETFSAHPGYSEHQTGLACDVSSPSVSWTLSDDYGDTEEGKWLAEHCHEYGFILRYFDGTTDEVGEITGYIYEPWHIRYVGVEHATYMYEHNMTLEEYLGILD